MLKYYFGGLRFLQDRRGAKPVVYLSDLASDRGQNADGAFVPGIAGGKLILAFGDLYKKHYLDTGKMTPIYTSARDETSYKILKRQLESLGTRLGYKFEF